MSHHIHFVRNSKGTPIGCVAFRDVILENNQSCVEYGISVHNPSDNWNRKLARQIAIGRLVEQPFRIQANPNWNISRMIEEINLDLPYRKVPTRLKREVSKNNKFQLPF